jgi:diguanylate cyclase (GGDEF)-like protein
MTDALTGLPNRRGFEVRLRELAAADDRGAAGHGGRRILIAVDLDRFKPLNDLYGHAVGDSALVEMSRRLKDLAGRDGVAARLGGDEFALSIRVPAGDDDLDDELENALAHTREALNRAMVIDGFVCRVGATLGAALMGEDGQGFDTLMRRADLALYDAKRRQRGSAARFRQHMEDVTLATAEMEMDLRAAIEREEIEPYYLALSDLNDGSIIGYEVLARWRHETRGDIPPAEFIPVAEDAGVITPMMESLLRRACSEVRDWEGAPNLAVNISPVQFRDPWLAGRILRILGETGFPPGRLEVELTEGVLTSDLAMARDVVISLKKEGVRIVLDDFGTGYSSLKYLRELPFDRLKIDRSFVQTYRDNPDSRSMVAAIFVLARGLAIGVTAEGIEDAECEAILKNLGCDYGQGYLYGKPRRQPAQVQLQFDMETAAEPARLSR